MPPRYLSIDLKDGRSVSVPIGWHPRLADGTPAERARSSDKRGWLWSTLADLDEDIGVEGLLLGKHSSESPSSFERWLQRRREKLPQDAA